MDGAAILFLSLLFAQNNVPSTQHSRACAKYRVYSSFNSSPNNNLSLVTLAASVTLHRTLLSYTTPAAHCYVRLYGGRVWGGREGGGMGPGSGPSSRDFNSSGAEHRGYSINITGPDWRPGPCPKIDAKCNGLAWTIDREVGNLPCTDPRDAVGTGAQTLTKNFGVRP